ncbi:carbohydrate ABC transporter permease [Bradyrhizobium sp.]|uniref:carbohydrate ABC transporter permease n=1 Tax=Bradyrhizobium sp. TaxID=376 RepID=UPI0040378884
MRLFKDAPLATRGEITPKLGFAFVVLLALVWLIPFLWMGVASLRPPSDGINAMAVLLPSLSPTLANFRDAWEIADFPLYFLNTTIICMGILLVQFVTVTLAGFAFARLAFAGKSLIFYLFLMQLMLVPVLLIVPNLTLVAKLGLYDTLTGVMMPFFASAFGTFLMRQAFEAIPRELEDAANIDGAGVLQRIRHIYVPLSLPSFSAFAIVSVTSHWNDFLWPLMVINSPHKRPLTVGLSVFTATAEGTQAWGTIAAGTLIVIAPLLVTFLIFQKRFISSFVTSGIK